MAASPGHKFGQMIGNLLEEIVEPVLLEFCEERGYFLDKKGIRIGARKGKKLSWEDKYGNSHDLDFVIERSESGEDTRRPLAFVEVAWRRYTKHSRNKAQEIQGAVLPISEKYVWDKPFLGAILAGVFTAPSLQQMRSVGFEVLYFPYETICGAFAAVDVDVAFGEQTSDTELQNIIRRVEALTDMQRSAVKANLQTANAAAITDFLERMRKALDRAIKRVMVIPLHGTGQDFRSMAAAAQFVESYAEDGAGGPFRKYEVIAEFTNGDRIQGEFASKAQALRFLEYVST